MCGIVGIVTKSHNGFFQKTETTFLQLLYADALRGDDSTGIIGVEKDNAFHIAKAAYGADLFLADYKQGADTKPIATAMYSKGKAYIGHNRKKTVGAIADATAHPFVVDNDFAMVHNGTLYNHKSLADTEVDSEALAIHLQKAIREGGEDRQKIAGEVEKALGDVQGAYAIAAYDQKNHRLHLLRNKERPLSIIETDDAWYFMSESLMGAWILARNGYEYKKLSFDHLDEHTLVSFDLETNKVFKDKLTVKKYSAPATTNTHTPASMGVVNSTASNNKGKPLKDHKDFKRLKKNWLGKRMAFWVDDFLEKNFPSTVDEHGETEVTILGAHEEIDFWHTVKAQVDLSRHDMHTSSDLTSRKWTGIVDDMSLTQTGAVIIEILDAKPMLPSTIMAELKDYRAFREFCQKKLSSELQHLLEDNKDDWPVWKKSAVANELAARGRFTCVEDAAKAARDKDGTILEQKLLNGKFVYVDSEGKIYYESSIVVH